MFILFFHSSLEDPTSFPGPLFFQSLAPEDGKKRDPGNEVMEDHYWNETNVWDKDDDDDEDDDDDYRNHKNHHSTDRPRRTRKTEPIVEDENEQENHEQEPTRDWPQELEKKRIR